MIWGERLRFRAALRATAVVASAVLVAACGGSGSPSAEPGVAPTSDPAGPDEAESSTDPAEDEALARYYDQKLSWKSCGTGFQCSKLKVPLDYSDPDGTVMRLSMIRLKVSGTGERIGSLLINPGGPGGSGIEYAREADNHISSGVRARYDVVGFDPRGVGTSDPIDCLGDAELDKNLEADASPDSQEEIEYLVEQAQALAEGCDERSGEYLAHIGTPNVARDLDVMRAVLGDEKLYFLGKSYGTYIGALYADMFPARVGRLVLDGALDPALPAGELTLAQAEGFQLAYNAFVAGCLDLDFCPIGTSKTEITQKITKLIDRLDSRPLPTTSGRRLVESLGVLGMIVAMYNETSWDVLHEALVLAFAGDGSGLLFLSDFYTDRDQRGRYKNNGNEVIYAVNCLDHPGDDSPEDIQGQLDAMREASPMFGEFISWGNLPCHYWPVQSETEPRAVAAAGADPILVIGTTRDPATPYAWAESLADQLDSGVLLTYDGDGHTAYGRGNRCVDTAVDKYLVRGAPPPDGKRCD